MALQANTHYVKKNQIKDIFTERFSLSCSIFKSLQIETTITETKHNDRKVIGDLHGVGFRYAVDRFSGLYTRDKNSYHTAELNSLNVLVI